MLQVVETRERIRGLVIAAPGRVFAAHRQCQHLFNLSRRRPSSRCQSSTCSRSSCLLSAARQPPTAPCTPLFSSTMTTTRTRTIAAIKSTSVVTKRRPGYRTCHDVTDDASVTVASGRSLCARRTINGAIGRDNRPQEVAVRETSTKSLSRSISSSFDEQDTRGSVWTGQRTATARDVCVSTLGDNG